MVVKDPDDIKTVLNSNESFEKGFLNHLFFKRGLFVDNGESYRNQRKHLIKSSFQPSAFRRHIPIINLEMDEIFKHFENKLSGNRVNAKKITARFSTRTVMQTVYGLSRKAESSEVDTIIRDGDG